MTGRIVTVDFHDATLFAVAGRVAYGGGGVIRPFVWPANPAKPWKKPPVWRPKPKPKD